MDEVLSGLRAHGPFILLALGGGAGWFGCVPVLLALLPLRNDARMGARNAWRARVGHVQQETTTYSSRDLVTHAFSQGARDASKFLLSYTKVTLYPLAPS